MGCPSHPTHDGGSARAGQTLQHVSLKVVNSAWAGTYGGCVVGQDRQELPRTLHRQVRRLLARRAASPNPDGRFEHTPLHPATRCPQHDGGTPCLVLQGSSDDRKGVLLAEQGLTLATRRRTGRT